MRQQIPKLINEHSDSYWLNGVGETNVSHKHCRCDKGPAFARFGEQELACRAVWVGSALRA
jgi:hypothetical protein